MNMWVQGSNDYVTIAWADKPINKVVRLVDGKLTKKPSSQISEGKGKTMPVQNLAEFAELLGKLSERNNAFLVLGFIPGTEDGKSFTVLSNRVMKQKLGLSDDAPDPVGIHEIDGVRCVTRTKANFVSSSILMFDYDRVVGMPASLETSDTNQWLGWIQKLLPGLEGCGYVLANSTTSRVLINNTPAYPDGGWHMYVQVKDARDAQRFGRDLLIYAMSTPYGFMRPIYNQETGEVLGHRPWLITDPTTFSPERAVYDGKPVVKGEGLSVAPSNARFVAGARFDTQSIAVPSDVSAQVERATGHSVERIKREGVMHYSLVNRTSLKLDTPLNTAKGVMTVKEYWKTEHNKLRIQAPFRPDSTSHAAYINRHRDGVPFVYDVGIQTKYVLEPAAAEAFKLELALYWIATASLDEVKAGWTDRAVGLNAMQQEEIRQAVHRRTAVSLRTLSAALREAIKEHKRTLAEQRVKDEIESRRSEGRVVIPWVDDLLNEVVDSVKRAVLSHQETSPLFNFGGIAATVKLGHPTSVRQIQRKHELGDEYPEQYVTFQHTPITMQMRIQESVSFQSADNSFIGCPSKVASALMDDPSFAPPLAGLLEVPSVTPKGVLLNTPGYDRSTGYYMVFDKKLGAINEQASKEDALEAVKYIKDTVFAGFPFASDLDADCAVAFLLTAFVRRFLSKAPGFMVTATTQASGKSTLVNIVFHAAFGRPAAASSWSSNQEEMQKHILAFLIEGQSGVNFDNLPYGCRVDGDELAKLITEPVYKARLLGTNTTPALPTNCLVSLTGNHLLAVNDMPSRLLPINLVPQTENPERTRHERVNIDAWHDENRPAIVQAVCSILLAWRDEGEKQDIEPSRFPDWDDAVRQPMAWLGLLDPSDAFTLNHLEDPVREARTELLQEWHRVFGDQWVELAEVASHWIVWENSDKDKELSDALRNVFDDSKPDARRMGLNFRYFKGNVFGGLRLEQRDVAGKSKASRPWRVVRVS